MNSTKRIPTGRELRWLRIRQWLLNPNPDIDATLFSFLVIGWGVLGWYIGV